MKYFLTILAFLFANASFCQILRADDWAEKAKMDFKMLPKYGYHLKTQTQQAADEKFVKETLQQLNFNGDRKAASDNMIAIGVNKLLQSPVDAMYHFNKAYLLDSTNANIYWGFGAVYMSIGDFQNAQIQYEVGLKSAPKNTHLLTDYGSYYLTQYNASRDLDPKGSATNLDSALYLLTKSFILNPTDPITTFKLSQSYLFKGECLKAWAYYDRCKTLENNPITEDFTSELSEKCKR